MRIFTVSIIAFALLGLVGSGCASGETEMALPLLDGDGGQDSSAPGTPDGTCDPAFCTAMGAGAPCCVTANGPCGNNFGMGCVAAGTPSPSGTGGPPSPTPGP